MATEEQIAEALIAAIDTQLSTYGTPDTVKALDYDDAATATHEHVQFSLARRYTPVERAGREGQKPYRATTRPVANTVGNGRTIAAHVDVALNGKRFTIDGDTTTPLRLETADDIGPDDGKFSGLTTWTFVL